MGAMATDSEAVSHLRVARRLSAALLLAPAITIALASFALLFRSDFYLTDDARAYFWPIFEEVSRLLRSGQAPFITDRLWHGGAFLAEYQPGLLNPISLLLVATLGSMSNLAIASAIYAIFHLSLLALGTSVFCRVLGCTTTYSIMAGVVGASSEWIVYFGAANWIPFAVSLAWVPWALAALVRTYESKRWMPLAAIAIAMVIVSGNTFTDLALLISVGMAGAMSFAAPQRDTKRLFITGAAVICGGLLSAPSILPLISAMQGTGRSIESWEWQTDLTSLVSFGVPYSTTTWTTFGGEHRLVFLPMLGVAWFLPPALANAPWRNLLSKHSFRVVLCATAAIGALSAGPAVWQFRWMFRLLPFYQFGLAILGALALSEAEVARLRWSSIPTWLSVGLPLWFAFWRAPGMQLLSTIFAIIVVAMTSIVLNARRGGLSHKGFAGLLLFGHAIVVVAVAAAYSSLPNRYPISVDLPATVDRTPQTGGPTRFMVFPSGTGLPGRPDTRVYRELFAGNASLEHSGVDINGYSDVWPAAYHRAFCLAYPGATDCPDIVRRLTTPVLPWGRDRLDLMRVDEVRFYNASQARAFALTAPGWRLSSSTAAGTAIFRREMPLDLPPPVGWVSPGTGVVPQRTTSDRVELGVRNPTDAVGVVLIARAWHPGWSATLAGRPLSVSSSDGIEVAVSIPPRASGLMVVRYWPQGLSLGLALAALGAGLVLAFFLWSMRPYSPDQHRKTPRNHAELSSP